MYDTKAVIVKNLSEADIYEVNIYQIEGPLMGKGSLSYIPIIYSGETKEYQVPYIKNSETAPDFIFEIAGFKSNRKSSSVLSYFTFDTYSNEDITLTFKEDPESSDPKYPDYLIVGEGSGFVEIEDID
jgi:hypothetical protein